MSDKRGNNWAFILGGSSGFGLATAKYLASKGLNIFIVHRNLRAEGKGFEPHFDEIKSLGVHFSSINKNAIGEENQALIIAQLKEALGNEGKIKLCLYSLADGNIGNICSGENDDLNEEAFEHTIRTMGTGIISWSKLLLESRLFSENARIIGITSEGGQKVIPGYAAIAAAKNVLESVNRSMAIEFAKYQITANLINAGITDSPALRAIPNHKALLQRAKERNPFNRLTQPQDVAKVIYLLTRDEANWINGEIIRVDGGEQIVF